MVGGICGDISPKYKKLILKLASNLVTLYFSKLNVYVNRYLFHLT